MGKDIFDRLANFGVGYWVGSIRRDRKQHIEAQLVLEWRRLELFVL